MGKKVSKSKKRKQPEPPQSSASTTDETTFYVEKIVKHYPRKAKSHAEANMYKISWLGYSKSHDSFEPAEKIKEDVPGMLKNYWKIQNGEKKIIKAVRKKPKNKPKSQPKSRPRPKKLNNTPKKKKKTAPTVTDYFDLSSLNLEENNFKLDNSFFSKNQVDYGIFKNRSVSPTDKYFSETTNTDQEIIKPPSVFAKSSSGSEKNLVIDEEFSPFEEIQETTSTKITKPETNYKSEPNYKEPDNEVNKRAKMTSPDENSSNYRHYIYSCMKLKSELSEGTEVLEGNCANCKIELFYVPTVNRECGHHICYPCSKLITVNDNGNCQICLKHVLEGLDMKIKDK